MKTKLLLIMILISTLMSCSKEETAPINTSPTTGKVTFYMLTSPGEWNLIIDGTDKGQLKETTQQPVCADPEFQTLILSIGHHTYDVKSMNGYAWGHITDFTVSAGCNTIKVK